MKNIVTKIITLSMVGVLLAGCSGKTPAPTDKPSGSEPLMYSNLTDAASQQEVSDVLQAHGVTAEQANTLTAWANDFNTRITSDPLPEGFNPMEKEGNNYTNVLINFREAPDGFIYPEANCRLASYLLMKNMVNTNKLLDNSDTYLMIDLDAIDTYDPFRLSPEEKDNFTTLFNWVPLKGADKLEEHIALIRQAWKDRAIQISGNGISLINVYLHSTFDDARFVGHSGVLVDTGDGLLFVEKYGPQAPFQATKFNNRDELKYYLVSRRDLYGDETELEPIVMENDQVI